MDTYDSQPEKGRATGAQSRRRGNNENSDTEQILDRALQGNISRLIGRQRSSAEVWEVFEITSYFVVRTAEEQWRFDTLWEAICQQQRLSTELAESEVSK
jgi:hypothetical protein